MDEDSKSDEMMDSFTSTGNKEICVKFDHDYCAAPRGERSGNQDHFMGVDDFCPPQLMWICATIPW